MHQDPHAAPVQSEEEAQRDMLMNCFQKGDTDLPHFVITVGQSTISGVPIGKKQPGVLREALGLRDDETDRTVRNTG